MIYRKEIDGLRALAVLPVILFHAGFEIFSGGYIGVDVFFVISGYLITSIIKDEVASSNFSLINFYERRARRILPALILVSITSTLAAWVMLTSQDMLLFSKSLIAVNSYISNIFFYFNSGYFDVSNELNPLLHTWSLSVEEQYYLFAPLLILIFWRFGTKTITFVFAAICLLSLLISQHLVHHNTSAAFYLLQSRIWELGLGALIAINSPIINKCLQNPTRREISSLLGLLLIITPIFTFSKNTDFPGINALLPTIGTALVILFASQKTVVGRLLANRLLVGLGVVSYSAYLWHQPLFAFTRQFSIAQPSVYIALLIITSTFVLAFFSWKYVEVPFRKKQTIETKPFFFTIFCFTSLLVLFGVIGIYTDGYKFRYKTPQYIETSFQRSTKAKACFDKNITQSPENWMCKVGNNSENAQFLVLGDSHLVSMFDTLNEAAIENNQSAYITGFSGCTPLLGIHALRDDQSIKNCHDLNNKVYAFVKKHQIKNLILVARWSYYTDGNYSGEKMSYIGTSASDEKSREQSRLAFKSGLNETIARYRKIGVNLIALSQIPQQKYEPKYLFDKLFVTGSLNTKQLRQSSVDYTQHLELQKFVNQSFNNTNGITYINLDKHFCDSQKCLIGDKGGSYYFDNNHLSIYGAKLLNNELKILLNN